MSYFDWESCVFKGSERMTLKEYNTPYTEEEVSKAGIGDACSESLKTVYHAVLGGGRLRICIYKSRISIFLDFMQLETPPVDECYSGEIDGCSFSIAVTTFSEGLKVKLLDYDGSVWIGLCYLEQEGYVFDLSELETV